MTKISTAWGELNTTITKPANYEEGVAPGDVVKSNEMNFVANVTTEGVGQMQENGILIYNPLLSYQIGCIIALQIDNVINIYQAQQIVPSGSSEMDYRYSPVSSPNLWSICAMGDALSKKGGVMTGVINFSSGDQTVTGGVLNLDCDVALKHTHKYKLKKLNGDDDLLIYSIDTSNNSNSSNNIIIEAQTNTTNIMLKNKATGSFLDVPPAGSARFKPTGAVTSYQMLDDGTSANLSGHLSAKENTDATGTGQYFSRSQFRNAIILDGTPRIEQGQEGDICFAIGHGVWVKRNGVWNIC